LRNETSVVEEYYLHGRRGIDYSKLTTTKKLATLPHPLSK
jgi:hypothetical protein